MGRDEGQGLVLSVESLCFGVLEEFKGYRGRFGMIICLEYFAFE